MPFNPWCFCMDTLRSCYTTLFRIPGIGVIPGRWFWTDALPVDKEHVYGSHNHIREDGDDDADTGEPGEVWGAPRHWYSGAPPIAGDCGPPIGEDRVWTGEEAGPFDTVPSPIWGPEFDLSMSEEFWSQYYFDNIFTPYS